MLKTRILKGEEYWEAYKRHKCTGSPVISVAVEEAKTKLVEKPVKTEWVRKPGSGEWMEVTK